MAKVNLKNVKRKLEKLLNEKSNLAFKYEFGADFVKATHEITLTKINAEILAVLTCYDSGFTAVELIFDKVERNHRSEELIAQFNANSFWLTAYISDNGYLITRYFIAQLSDVDDIVSNIEWGMLQATNDRNSDLLRPLVEMM